MATLGNVIAMGRVVFTPPSGIVSFASLEDDLMARRRDRWFPALALQVGLNRNPELFDWITGFDVNDSTSIYDGQPIVLFDFYERDGYGPNYRIIIKRDQAAEWAGRPNYVRLAAAYVIRELEKMIRAAHPEGR